MLTGWELHRALSSLERICANIWCLSRWWPNQHFHIRQASSSNFSGRNEVHDWCSNILACFGNSSTRSRQKEVFTRKSNLEQIMFVQSSKDALRKRFKTIKADLNKNYVLLYAGPCGHYMQDMMLLFKGI